MHLLVHSPWHRDVLPLEVDEDVCASALVRAVEEALGLGARSIVLHRGSGWEEGDPLSDSEDMGLADGMSLYVSKSSLQEARELVQPSAGAETLQDEAAVIRAAAQHGHAEAVVVLLGTRGGRRVELAEPLLEAVAEKNYDCARALLDGGAQDTARDSFGRCALHHAVEEYQDDLVRLLVERAASPLNLQDDDGHTPLHVASVSAAEEIGLYLLEAGADFDVLDERDYTPLHHAVAVGLTDLTRELLAKGASVSEGNEYDESPLHLAVRCNPGLMDMLLTKATKEDLAALNMCGWTALHCAASNGYEAICAQLIQAGADPRMKTDCCDQLTPASIARSRGFESLAAFLEKAAEAHDASDAEQAKSASADGASAAEAEEA